MRRKSSITKRPLSQALTLSMIATLSSALYGIDIQVDKVPASIVVEYLRARDCAAVSFIDYDQRSVVSLNLRGVTVEEVLSKIAAQNSAYRSENIAGRAVLYPAAPEFKATVDNVDIQRQPRQEATELYVDFLRRAVPAFSRLVPPVLFGDDRMPIYSDKVTLRPKGRVIEHFVDLLGEDHALYFHFIKAMSGLPSLDFERLSCKSTLPQKLPQVNPWHCDGGGPSSSWVLSSRPPLGIMEGHLGAEIFHHLHVLGIPVSFVSRSSGDPYVRLQVPTGTTTKGILEAIQAQAPGYQIGVVDGRVVLYPKDERYDAQIDITAKNDVTRGAAIYPLLRELKAKSEVLSLLVPPALRVMGRSIWGYKVNVGGSRSAIEHMVSLMGNDPSITLRVVATGGGHLAYELDWTPVVRKIDLHVPSTIHVGAGFQVAVTGRLADGTTISLSGENCGVTYNVLNGGFVDVDNAGRGVALKKGEGLIGVIYEGYQSATAEVRVE